MNISSSTALIVLISVTCLAAEAAPGAEPDPKPSAATAAGRAPAPAESRWRLGAAFGYGLRSNPLIQSEDIPIIVDLDIAWFGERFFFDNGDLGFTFLDNARATASMVARFNSDRVFFGKTDTRFVTIGLAGEALSVAAEVKVPDRDYAVEMGVELLTDGRWGYLQAAAFHDVSATHGGYEIGFDYGYGWRNQRWYIEPSVGLSYTSAAMNDYYWGVRQAESSAALPPYQAGFGLNVRGRLVSSYQITRHWSFSLAAEFDRLNDEAAASPIVAERNVFGYFAGFGYRFR